MNPKKAADLFKKSASLGSGLAAIELGHLYRYGDGVNKDEKKALELYRQALRPAGCVAYAHMAHVCPTPEEAFACWGKFFHGLPEMGQDYMDLYDVPHVIATFVFTELVSQRRGNPIFSKEQLLHHLSQLLPHREAIIDQLLEFYGPSTAFLKDWIDDFIVALRSLP